MKAYKKIISFILTLVMMLSLSVNVFAAEPLTDDPNMIEWKYTVFANESLQKVVEEGVIPNAYARYTWRGITLKNGEVAILTPSNNSMGLYCNSGRYITINYTLKIICIIFPLYHRITNIQCRNLNPRYDIRINRF